MFVLVWVFFFCYYAHFGCRTHKTTSKFSIMWNFWCFNSISHRIHLMNFSYLKVCIQSVSFISTSSVGTEEKLEFPKGHSVHLSLTPVTVTIWLVFNLYLCLISTDYSNLNKINPIITVSLLEDKLPLSISEWKSFKIACETVP